MKKYTVTADVNSETFGKGQLVAQLNEAEFIEYANLSDKDKLEFLKNKGAQFKTDISQLSEDDVDNYKIQSAGTYQTQTTQDGQTQSSRKMRMNINGRDTGWVDVTEENEEQYNALMEQFNNMHKQMDERISRIFGPRPSSILGFDDPFQDSRRLEDKSDNSDESQGA